MINKAIIVGRVGKDPEIRRLDSGVVVAQLNIATSEKWRDKTTGESRESTEWHNVVAWRNLAEICERWVQKGALVYIEGKITTRSWEADGVKKYRTEIVADSIRLLGGKSDRPEGAVSAQADAPAEGDDDLPF